MRAPARRWIDWAVAAAVAAPVAIVLHELGHFLAGLAFGFPDLVLHYGNVSDGAAEAGFPAWQQGVRAAAGPLVTLLIAFGCCLATRRLGSKSWTMAPAFAAGIRSVAIGLTYLGARVIGRDPQGNFDEMNAARHLGVAPEIVISANLLLMLGAWIFLVARIQPGQRVAILSAVAAGTVAGVALYAGWLGPWLLP